MITAPTKRFLTAVELDECGPWTLNTIRKMTSLGLLPHIKVGRKVIYDWDEICAFLERRAIADRR